jgi:putative endonuclease
MVFTQRSLQQPERPSSHPRNPDARRALGRLGEELAAAHLKRLSFSIVARNVRTRAGEIDLIAFDGVTLVFMNAR